MVLLIYVFKYYTRVKIFYSFVDDVSANTFTIFFSLIYKSAKENYQSLSSKLKSAIDLNSLNFRFSNNCPFRGEDGLDHCEGSS